MTVTSTDQFHAFTLAGTQLTGTDETGCRWTVETVNGWFDGAELRTDSQPRTGQDGAWVGRPFLSSRVITLRGKVFAPTTTALEQAARRLSAILPTGSRNVLNGLSGAGDYSATVWSADRPLFQPLSDTAAAWQVSVESDDPLLYGPIVFGSTALGSTAGGAGLTYPLTYPLDYGIIAGVIPGALTIPNDGTASYLPRLRIDGPVTNPIVTLADTGDWIRYGGTIPVSSWLDIDCTSRRVLLNGQVSHRHLITFQGAWLAVPVGGASITWTADTADPAAALSVWGYQGAWI
jgi:hypothetical protein